MNESSFHFDTHFGKLIHSTSSSQNVDGWFSLIAFVFFVKKLPVWLMVYVVQ